MADLNPTTAAPESKVVFASPATVKRRKMSYGRVGLLALTQDRLTFSTPDASTSWDVPTASITDLKKPWYGMGSYLTFQVNGACYALAFGKRGPNLAASAGDLSIRSGGAAGVGAGLVGDAIAVSQMSAAAGLGGRWYALLRQAARA